MSDFGQIEKLEDRQLLAVGVSFKAKKGILVIKGDGASDAVEVEGGGSSSEVEVFVNGGSVGTFEGVKTIKASMGAGDDTLSLSSIHIGGSVVANMGSGADEFDIDDNAANNTDRPTLIGGSIIAKMGGNAGDFVDWDNSNGDGIVIGNNVSLLGVADVDLNGDGGSHAVQDSDIDILGFLRITLNGSGNVGGNSADLYLDDVNVGGTTLIRGSKFDDVVRIEESSFGRRVNIALGGGDDLLDLDNPGHNDFHSNTLFNGGGGTDTFDDEGANHYAIPGDPVVRKFETIT